MKTIRAIYIDNGIEVFQLDFVILCILLRWVFEIAVFKIKVWFAIRDKKNKKLTLRFHRNHKYHGIQSYPYHSSEIYHIQNYGISHF